MNSSSSDRPQYPRTQYNIQRSHNSNLDPAALPQNAQLDNPYQYEVVPSNYR